MFTSIKAVQPEGPLGEKDGEPSAVLQPGAIVARRRGPQLARYHHRGVVGRSAAPCWPPRSKP
jgi:hypothetical protein